jgi:nanoRNase/pAp phosphatase (c-di-AMP/oligoRNAs hydrolase)
MWRNLSINQEVDVDFEYEVEFDEILELIEKCNQKEREKITEVINNSEVSDKAKRKSLYISDYVDIDFEYDVDLNEILNLVENCSRIEKNQILKIIGEDTENTSIIAGNLYDEEKVKLLKYAFRKYDLDELMSRLDIKRHEF